MDRAWNDPGVDLGGAQRLEGIVSRKKLITSVTSPFCGDCTRARLSADGRLFTCLFATQGHDLLGEIRVRNPDDEELYRMIAGLWRARSDRYSELRALSASGEGPPKVEMSFIGG